MESEIQEQLVQLGNSLTKHSAIVEYKELKRQINNSSIVKYYEDKIEEAQKEMVQAKHYEKESAYKYWEQQWEIYNQKLLNHPLVVAYKQSLQEADELLQLITTIISEQVNRDMEKEE